ncbi:sulfatase [Acidobacteriota bacterium]
MRDDLVNAVRAGGIVGIAFGAVDTIFSLLSKNLGIGDRTFWLATVSGSGRYILFGVASALVLYLLIHFLAMAFCKAGHPVFHGRTFFMLGLLSLWVCVLGGPKLHHHNALRPRLGAGLSWMILESALILVCIVTSTCLFQWFSNLAGSETTGIPGLDYLLLALAFAMFVTGGLFFNERVPGILTPKSILFNVFFSGGIALALWACVRGLAGLRGATTRARIPARVFRLAGWTGLAVIVFCSLVIEGPFSFTNSRPVEKGESSLVSIGDERRAVLGAPCPSEFRFPFAPRSRIELEFGYKNLLPHDNLRYDAHLAFDSGKEIALFSRVISGANSRRARHYQEIIDPLTVDTAGAELVLRATGTCREAYWAPPLFSNLGGLPKGPSVIVVSLDTLRADHLNAYGYEKRITSPEFDAWAQHGVLFENAISQAPGTLSSQMSILTGRYPSSHNVTYRQWRKGNAIPVLGRNIPTVAEIASANGVLTVAYTGAVYFSKPIGYARGFQRYVSTDDWTYGSVDNVFEKAFHWLRHHRHDRFFLFLHTYEIHYPYTQEMFVHAENLLPEEPGPYNEALYDGGIRKVDLYLGKLRRLLRETGIEPNTLVFIVSDHGEEFGDHYPVFSSGHGYSLFEEQVHVPFLAIMPGKFEGGRRIAAPVELIDIAPTMLELLGIPIPPGMEGKSLLPMLRGDATGEGCRAFSEDVFIGPERKCVRSGKWKYVLTVDDDANGNSIAIMERSLTEQISKHLMVTDKEMLFDLTDPQGAEKKNLLGAEPEIRRMMRTHLERWKERYQGELPPVSSLPMDEETVEMLKTVGYME